MNRTLHYVALFISVSGALMLTTMPLFAQDYNSIWEASSGLTPEEVCPSWLNGSSIRPSLADGYLTISTSLCSSNRFYEVREPDIVFPDPVIVEFVARLVSTDTCEPCNGRRAIGINVQPEPYVGVHMWVGHDIVLINHSTPHDCDDYSTASVDTDDAFHTYRIEVTASGAVSVYYDESWILSGHTFHDPEDFGAVPLINWGEVSFYSYGTAEWKSVKHNAAASDCRCLTRPWGVAAWWSADGSPADLKGGYGGTLGGGTSFLSGKVGQAFGFDGSGDYVSVPDGSIWDFGTGDFTIEFWVSLDQISRSMFLHQQSGPNKGGFEFGYHEDVTSLFFNTDNTNRVFEQPWSPQINTWYHLALTREAGEYRAYVDGVVLGPPQADSTSVADVSGIARIGNWVDGGWDVHGAMDEISVYHRSLSPTEIRAIYLAGASGLCKGDRDEDGFRDFEDNCLLDQNNQDDADSDHAGDECDCLSSDATVWGEPTNLQHLLCGFGGNRDHIDWSLDAREFGPGTSYDLMQGGLSEFPVGTGTAEVCLDDNITETEYVDTTTPVLGSGLYYLLRGANACGAGGYETGGSVPRPSDVCP